MNRQTGDNILNEYDNNCQTYHALCRQCENLIKSLLESKNISIHSITFRVKERESLQTKLVKKEFKYSCLAEITDVAGI
jgi:putative GTP pyrophosphokinase